MKTCNKCLIKQSLDNYRSHSTTKDHKRTICKSCDDANQRRWYAANKEEYAATTLAWQRKNPEKRKGYRIKATYGISFDDFLDMLKAQENKCKICGTAHSMNTSKTRLCIDHDHVTGKVRGLLCDKCNRGLGVFRDNPEFLLKAAEYLKNA